MSQNILCSASKLSWMIGCLMFSGCVEQLVIESESPYQPELVVEGSIDDFSEFFVVRLGTTVPGGGVGENILGRNATVQILSSTGESHVLEEVSPPGTYAIQRSTFTPVNESTYLLDIQLENGEQYQSTPVMMPERLPVVEMRAEFVDLSGEDDRGTAFRAFAHDIYATITNADSSQFFKMDITGWEEMRVAYLDEIPAPETCWALREPAVRQISVAQNAGIDQTQYEVLVGTIPANVRGRYIAEVLFSSMSRETMVFWDAASRQLNRDEGVFSAPFPTVVGNIRNVNKPSEVVHGYFHAYSKTLSRVCFDTHGLPLIYDIPLLLIPCSEFFAPAVDYLPFEDELCNE